LINHHKNAKFFKVNPARHAPTPDHNKYEWHRKSGTPKETNDENVFESQQQQQQHTQTAQTTTETHKKEI
jgi:hypothetical protein